MLDNRAPSRRIFGQVTRVIGLTLVTIASLVACGSISTESNVGEHEFERNLHIPPMLEPVIADDGVKHFDLALEEGDTELLPGTKTETWGMNGTYHSPVIRAERGDDVQVNVQNGLSEVTTLHWHGMHLPARMDGGPHQMIQPEETWSPLWTINQPAATLWFHPHLHGSTAEHVYRGAAGMFIIDDPELENLGIPSDYGIDDIPLIVEDKKFNADGSLDFSGSSLSNLGVLGDEILVNGTHAPVFEAERSLVRFRILNASVARIYDFGFEDDRSFSMIGSDTGLLEEPVALNRILLSPGERAEIVVQVEAEDDVMLRSFAPDLGMDAWNERVNGGNDNFEILRLTGSPDLEESPSLPDELVEIARPVEADSVATRTFSLDSSTSINGQRMEMDRIDEVVEVDTTEIWEITNSSGMLHSFHIHLIHFVILDIDGEEPPAHLSGWKDTILVPRGSTVRIIAEFKDYADPEVPYMYHCHILRHEDRGMMGQFVVVEPGMDVPSRIPVGTEHEH